MAITLPDFTALPQVTPQAGGSLMQYPSTDPVATGEATLGKGLEAAGGAATDVAAYSDIAKTRADRAMAEADLLGRTTQLDAQLKTETDPQKITDLSNAYQDALNTSSQAIGNTDARSMWVAQNQHRVALGQANAYLKNTEVYRDNYLAGADQQLTNLTQIATSSDDPAARADAQSKIGALIEGMKGSGTISAAKAQELSDKVAQGLILGRSDFLSATGRSGEALTYLQQNGQHVPPAEYDTRTQRYKERDKIDGGQRLANKVKGIADGSGGGGTPAPADIPAAPVAPDQYKPVIDQAASQYNVPPELLTRVLSAENDFTTREGSVIQSGPYKGQTAKGIAQFLDETAAKYGVNVNDTTSSINGAAHYLADLKAQTGSWHGALTGYLGGDPANDPSYTKKGAWQFADYLDAPVVQGQGDATRNLPIAPTVNAQLGKAATADGGLKVEVFSGGQPSTGENRVGSHRHDQGDAADVQLRDTKTGQLLDMRKPEDRARMQGFITAAVAAGATGVGAAEDYMGPYGIHIGGGPPAAWGAGGSSANAPGWVKSAFDAGRAQAQVAPTAPTTATTAAPAGPPQKFDIAGGDSIAYGFQQSANVPGSRTGRASDEAAPSSDAAGGRGAQGNLDYLLAHPERFANKNVIWSTGLMNEGGKDESADVAREQLPIVEKQLIELKRLGANVVVAGTDQGNYASLNPDIAKLAASQQFGFGGALPTHDVHPSPQGYINYAANAARKLPARAATAAPAAAAPAPAVGGSSVAARLANPAAAQPAAAPAPAPPAAAPAQPAATLTPAAATTVPAEPAAPPAGQVEPANTPIKIQFNRPLTIEDNGKQVVIPTEAPGSGRKLTDAAAIKQYKDTGQNFGKFDTVGNANAAIEQFLQQQTHDDDHAATTELSPAATAIAQGMQGAAQAGGGAQFAGPGAAAPADQLAPSTGQDDYGGGGPLAKPAPAAPPAAPSAPTIDDTFQRRLKAINDDPGFNQIQKDAAANIITREYNQQKAAANDALKKADAQITRLTQTAATHDDPTQRDAAAKNIDSLIDGLRTSGYISPEQAATLSDKALGDVVVARADYLDASGSASQARQYLDQYKQVVPPAELDRRMTTFKEREKTQGGEALANKVAAANPLTTPPDQLPPGTPDAVSRSQAATAQLVDLENRYQQQLQGIGADTTFDRYQKDVATRLVNADYQREKLALGDQAKKEASAVNLLMKDDESSILNGGVPIAQLTTERVRNALGDDAAAQFDELRAGAFNYYRNTHDLPNQTQPEIDQRILSLKPKDGMPGFAMNQKIYDAASKYAEDLRKQRITDPSASVATLPDVQEAAKTASLDKPETFAPLVYTRIHAMDRVGIPAENQIPITNQEALELWKPIGLATEGGNPREIKDALTDTVLRLQTATNGVNANQALEAVLRAGHASQQTAGIAAALVKKISRNEVPTQADAAALDEAQKTDATNKAAAQMQNDYQVRTVGEPVVPQSVPARTWPAPDATALQMLKAEPGRAAQFDATYGPGQAAKALQTMTPRPTTMPPVQPPTLNQLVTQP